MRLIKDPMVIFGDEPTGALNRTTAGQILDILSEINRRGTTLVVVTQRLARLGVVLATHGV